MSHEMLFSNWVSSVTPKMKVTSLISSSGTACQHHHHQINHAYTISLLEAQHFLLSRQRNKIKIQVCSTRAQCKHVSSEENSNNSKIAITVCYPCVCHKKRNSRNEGIHVPQIRKTGGGIQQIGGLDGGSWLLERISEVLFLQAFTFLCLLCCD